MRLAPRALRITGSAGFCDEVRRAGAASRVSLPARMTRTMFGGLWGEANMNAVYFLRERTSFIRFYYDESEKPFREFNER
jgi:hypothetical protein